jgi:hypothetical protein
MAREIFTEEESTVVGDPSESILPRGLYVASNAAEPRILPPWLGYGATKKKGIVAVPLRASNIFDASGEGERWQTWKSRLVELGEVGEGWMRDGEDGVMAGARG